MKFEEAPREHFPTTLDQGERVRHIEAEEVEIIPPAREIAIETPESSEVIELRKAQLSRTREEALALAQNEDAIRDDEGEKDRLPYTEVYQTYKRCEACNGKGRRWLLFVCSVCKGFGSLVATTQKSTGYYETSLKK